MAREIIIEGINSAKGIELCGGNPDDYIEILKITVETSKEKIATIDSYIASDIPRYKIEIHGIKGLCYNIGADSYGDEAKALEFAARDNEIDFINANHSLFMSKFQILIDNIEGWLSSNGCADEADEISGDYVEILKQIYSAIDDFDFPRAEKLAGKINTEGDSAKQQVVNDILRCIDEIEMDELYEILEKEIG